MSTQDQLTEDLWFLSKLRSNIPGGSYVPAEHVSTLTILDAVATYLTSGQSDGVIACYYQDTPATLILAKGGCVNDEDRSAATSLLKELTAAKDWLDLIPFLSQRSPDQVNKKIRKLRTSFAKDFGFLCEAAKEYEPNPDPSMHEFRGRWSRAFLKMNGLNQTVPAEVPQTLAHVLNLCNDYLTKNLEFGNTRTAWIDFVELLYVARTLFDSQFLSTLGDTTLKRHLAKVTQYIDIAYAIKFLRRFDGEICVEWVTDVAYGTVKRMLDTTAVGNRFKKTFVEDSDLVIDAKDLMLLKMNSKFPGWSGNQEEPIQVILSVHPEIRLYMDLVKRNITQDGDIVIGCSQKRCYACKLWIKELESATRMRSITDLEFGGKPRFDWACPDLTVLRSDDGQLGTDPNSHVKREVENSIRGILGKEQFDAFDLYLDNKMIDHWLGRLGRRD
ncbi:hypothetical protein J132_04316 [Termitomyces sp. J132]|nr:hypothetical protein H2248_008902 [Termitomyces sp. 'cryptogamus']KNZ80811.1 hypothetical protein J132_04316 [Termitomyces sp. J132]